MLDTSPRLTLFSPHPSSLFTELLTDALAERTYDADLAGLSHHVSSQMQGIRVSVGGYSDKLVVLLQTILAEMKSFVVNPERLAVYKEQVSQSVGSPLNSRE